MRDYAPVDEGEAEVEPASPVFVVRLSSAVEHFHDGYPDTIRIDIEKGWGNRARLDGLLHAHAVSLLQRQDLLTDGRPTYEWITEDGAIYRRATYRVTGYVPEA